MRWHNQRCATISSAASSNAVQVVLVLSDSMRPVSLSLCIPKVVSPRRVRPLPGSPSPLCLPFQEDAMLMDLIQKHGTSRSVVSRCPHTLVTQSLVLVSRCEQLVQNKKQFDEVLSDEWLNQRIPGSMLLQRHHHRQAIGVIA